MSSVLLAAYHVYLRIRIAKDPGYTIQSVNFKARALWVERIMKSGEDGVLAVQTLRNSTMAATLMASTSVILVIGVLTLSGQGDKLGATWHVLNPGDISAEIWLLKLIMVLLCFFTAFFSFSLSVRMFNHVGYLINVPLSMGQSLISAEYVAVYLNQAGKYYSVGMRAFYFSVPLIFWLFGPQFMLSATIALIVALYRIDRAPTSTAD
ncbi:MAG: DUF599 domain-containing protein [Nitrospinae bacterium]|nr:DUF599 domain-containing protein [Nitrospinota bacterium]